MLPPSSTCMSLIFLGPKYPHLSLFNPLTTMPLTSPVSNYLYLTAPYLISPFSSLPPMSSSNSVSKNADRLSEVDMDQEQPGSGEE